MLRISEATVGILSRELLIFRLLDMILRVLEIKDLIVAVFKPKKLKIDGYILLQVLYIGISLIGLCFLTFFSFRNSVHITSLILSRQVAFSTFGLICVLGIIAGISPSRCSGIRHSKRNYNISSNDTHNNKIEQKQIALEGHHPSCANFSSHVLLFRGKIYCSGCAGLVTGAAISLLGLLIYSIIGVHIGRGGPLIFLLGFSSVSCGLFQYNIPIDNALFHFLLNVIYVLGTFLLLIGMNDLVDDASLNFFFLLWVVYLIIARISLSKLEHRKLCAMCKLDSCKRVFC